MPNLKEQWPEWRMEIANRRSAISYATIFEIWKDKRFVLDMIANQQLILKALYWLLDQCERNAGDE